MDKPLVVAAYPAAAEYTLEEPECWSKYTSMIEWPSKEHKEKIDLLLGPEPNHIAIIRLTLQIEQAPGDYVAAKSALARTKRGFVGLFRWVSTNGLFGMPKDGLDQDDRLHRGTRYWSGVWSDCILFDRRMALVAYVISVYNSKVACRLTGSLRDSTPEQRGAMCDTLAHLVGLISSLIEDPRFHWHPASGSQPWLLRTDTLDLLSALFRAQCCFCRFYWVPCEDTGGVNVRHFVDDVLTARHVDVIGRTTLKTCTDQPTAESRLEAQVEQYTTRLAAIMRHLTAFDSANKRDAGLPQCDRASSFGGYKPLLEYATRFRLYVSHRYHILRAIQAYGLLVALGSDYMTPDQITRLSGHYKTPADTAMSCLYSHLACVPKWTPPRSIFKRHSGSTLDEVVVSLHVKATQLSGTVKGTATPVNIEADTDLVTESTPIPPHAYWSSSASTIDTLLSAIPRV